MPRGAQVDHAATAEAGFLDPWTPNDHGGSFYGKDGHQYLARRDRSKRRAEVWKRSKYCAMCGKYVGWQEMEMDHRQGGLVGRCDCLNCDRHSDGLGNVQTVCADCHRPTPESGGRSKHL